MAHVVSSSTALAFCTSMSGNVNMCNLVRSKRKSPWKESVLKRNCNKQTWTRWMNCWHALLRLGSRIDNVHTISDNGDKIKESGTCGAEVFVCEDYHSLVWNKTYQKLWTWVSNIFISNEIDILYRNVSLLYRNIYIHIQVCMSTGAVAIHRIG